MFLNSFACERCFEKKGDFFFCHDHCPMNGKLDLSLSTNMFCGNGYLVDYEIPRNEPQKSLPPRGRLDEGTFAGAVKSEGWGVGFGGSLQ